MFTGSAETGDGSGGLMCVALIELEADDEDAAGGCHGVVAVAIFACEGNANFGIGSGR